MSGPVIVGYDGSEASEPALGRAIEEASAAGATVVVVSVAEMPFDPEAPINYGTYTDTPKSVPLHEPPELEQILGAARERIDAAGVRGRLRLGGGRRRDRAHPRGEGSGRGGDRLGQGPSQPPRPLARHGRRQGGRELRRLSRDRRRLTDARSMSSTPRSIPFVETPSDVPDVLAPGLARGLLRDQPRTRVGCGAARTSRTRATTSGGCCTTPGFTPRLLDPQEQFDLLELGFGVTNAAYRTTPGSGDLRKGDFAGSAERLRALADELRPRAIAFVGQGGVPRRVRRAARARAAGAAGSATRRSSSSRRRRRRTRPCRTRSGCAAFAELKAWLDTPRLREGVRAVVLDPDDRVLLARIVFPSGVELWATPGGGVEPGESDEHALRRELAEEVGLDEFELGPLVWRRVQDWEDLSPRWDGQRERTYLVRVPRVRAGAAFHAGRARGRVRVRRCAGGRRRSWRRATRRSRLRGCRSSSPRSCETGRLPRRSHVG